MIKAIIIDDEEMARTLLSGMIKEFCPEVDVIEQCRDLASGVKAIRKHSPDLVFLDIEMPGMSGLQLLDFFNDEEINFSIIFVTAYNQYAIQALKLSAVDYLLKPIEVSDLTHSLELYEKRSKTKNYDLLRENLSGNTPQKIAVTTQNSIKYVPIDDITYIKGDGSYTHIMLANHTELVVSKGLKYFEDILIPNKNFIRSHRSYIVNIHYITEYIKSDGGYLVVNGNQISVTSEKLNEITDLIQKNKLD